MEIVADTRMPEKAVAIRRIEGTLTITMITGLCDTLLVTRVHGGASATLPAVSRIVDFAARASTMFDRTFGVGDNLEYVEYCDNLKKRLSEASSTVTVLPVTPWGQFTLALNAAISVAVKNKYTYIAFQSLEVAISAADILQIHSHMQPDTLVAGAAFPGHEFVIGKHDITGRRCPWNTFAIWNVRMLAITGFPLIADGFGDDIPSGVEEVSAISMLQLLHPEYKAKLVSLSSIEWHTTFTDTAREEYHNSKMKSKDSRPHLQLSAAGIPPGHVVHIDSSNTRVST